MYTIKWRLVSARRNYKLRHKSILEELFSHWKLCTLQFTNKRTRIIPVSVVREPLGFLLSFACLLFIYLFICKSFCFLGCNCLCERAYINLYLNSLICPTHKYFMMDVCSINNQTCCLIRKNFSITKYILKTNPT